MFELAQDDAIVSNSGLRIVATNVGTVQAQPFKHLKNLEYAEISGPFESFGTSTFLGCNNLKKVVAVNTSNTPATNSGVFSSLSAVADVSLHNIEIGYRMFYNVKTLTNLTITGTYTTIGIEAFCGTKITSFVIPAGFTLIDDRAFQNVTTLTEITFAGNAGENAVIDQAAFEGCTGLTTLMIPEGVTTLGNCVCKKAGLTTLSLPSTLTTLNGSEHFWNTKLSNIIGFENTKITSIPNSSFRGFSNWKPDVLRIPDTVKSIGEYGLADAGAKYIILGTGIETLGKEVFVNCPNVKAYYLPDTITAIGADAFKNNKTNNILFFVASTDKDYIGTISTSTGVANTDTYANYIVNEAGFASGKYIITGINKCVAFYNGKHESSEVENIIVSSYFEAIKVGSACTRGCGEVSISKTIDAIFGDYGYSCTEEAIGGSYSMSQFFGVNAEALNAYVKLTGKSFTYGLVASGSANPLKYENGELVVADKSFTKGSETFAHDFFGIKINGMSKGDNLDKAIVFCAYVVDGENVFYLDNGVTATAVNGISYNEVYKLMN